MQFFVQESELSELELNFVQSFDWESSRFLYAQIFPELLPDGPSLYGFVGNSSIDKIDILGMVTFGEWLSNATEEELKKRGEQFNNSLEGLRRKIREACTPEEKAKIRNRIKQFANRTKQISKKAGKKVVKFGAKKVPVVGWGLAAEGAISGYQSGGFWGGLSGALW